MQNAGTERAKGVRKRPVGGGKWRENAKKILNSGNEPKDLLNTQDLAFFGAKNELNFEFKNVRIKAKKQVSGVR
jgi:hypothetical protein